MSKTGIYVSFDLENDAELYERLLSESQAPTSGFAVVDASSRPSGTDAWSERLRDRIREADQVIVICGEHTEESASVGAELLMAQEEDTPYFLLWGRRESMCTKPIGAKPAEPMYSWTQKILQDQINVALRKAGADATARHTRESTRKS